MEKFNYKPLHHQEIIRKWRIKHAMSESGADELPEMGTIAYEGDLPVAAGFVRMTENSKSALLDSFITNPDVSGILRNEALDVVGSDLVSKARAAGVRNLICFSTDEHTLIRSLKHGFSVLPFTMTGMSLEE